MKPYKTQEMNNKVREAVKTAKTYLDSHMSVGRKYLTSDEFTLDMCGICNVPYSIGKRVTWFIRSDAARDEQALITWGFNKHTA